MHVCILLVCVFCVRGIMAYPDGTVEESCQSMFPNHSDIEPQTNSSPYSVSVNSTTFRPGQSIIGETHFPAPATLFVTVIFLTKGFLSYLCNFINCYSCGTELTHFYVLLSLLVYLVLNDRRTKMFYSYDVILPKARIIIMWWFHITHIIIRVFSSKAHDYVISKGQIELHWKAWRGQHTSLCLTFSNPAGAGELLWIPRLHVTGPGGGQKRSIGTIYINKHCPIPCAELL